MKSSSSINIGNGNNCTENQKAAATASYTSPASSANINKFVTKTNTALIKSSNANKDNIKRQEEQLNEFIQPARSFLINSASSFQSDSLSSNFKFELTPQTINHFNYQQPITQRRPRIKWTKRHVSSGSKTQSSSANSSIVFLRSSIDLNATMTTNEGTETPIAPDISITEVTNQYHTYIEKVHQLTTNQNETNHKIISSPTQIVNHEKTKSKTNHVDNEKDKVYVDQASQATISDVKSKQTIKSATSYRKMMSATKRPKQPSATTLTQQSTQPILSSTSPNRSASQNDVLTTITTGQKSLASSTKVDDSNAGKNLITVDTSKARSNHEVVRSCLRELGWKEVKDNLIILCNMSFFILVLYSNEC